MAIPGTCPTRNCTKACSHLHHAPLHTAHHTGHSNTRQPAVLQTHKYDSVPLPHGPTSHLVRCAACKDSTHPSLQGAFKGLDKGQHAIQLYSCLEKECLLMSQTIAHTCHTVCSRKAHASHGQKHTTTTSLVVGIANTSVKDCAANSLSAPAITTADMTACALHLHLQLSFSTSKCKLCCNTASSCKPACAASVLPTAAAITANPPAATQ